MVQGYTQQDSGSKGGWTSSLDSRRAECGKSSARTTIYRNEVFLCSYTCGCANDQWAAYILFNNNLAERAIRPLTTQRNSMQHFGSDEGAEMAATYHSIISTVKL